MFGLGVGTIVLLSVWSLWLLGACEQLSFHRARDARSRWPMTVRLEPSVNLKPGWPVRLSAVAAGLGWVLVPTSLVGWRAYLVVTLATLAVITAFAGGADAGQAQPAADQRPIPVKITNGQGRRLVLSSVSLVGVLWLVASGGGGYWDYVLQVRLLALVIIVVVLIVYGRILGLPELPRLARPRHLAGSAQNHESAKTTSADERDKQDEAHREEIHHLLGAHQMEIRDLHEAYDAALAALMAVPSGSPAPSFADGPNDAAGDNDGRHHGEMSRPKGVAGMGAENHRHGGAHPAGRADSGAQRPSAHGQAPPGPDRVSAATARRAGPDGPPLTWAYYVPGDRGDRAGSGDGAAHRGRLRLAASGDRELPPEAATAILQAWSDLDAAAAELPDGFESWSRKDQLRQVGEIARHSSGRWPLVLGAAANGEDLPGETEWAVFFSPSTACAQDGTAPAAPPPGAPIPSGPTSARPGDPAPGAPPEEGLSQAILLLDTLAIDTLLAALLGRSGPAPAGVTEIRVIKIIIQPRGLVIMAVKVALNAFLNVHGLGVLAPACGRITTKILQAILNYLLGPDRRFAELKKALDAFEKFLYAANGRPADSQSLRDQFAQWAAGGPRPHEGTTSKASPTGWESDYWAPADDSRSASDGWYDGGARDPRDGPWRSAASPLASQEPAAPGQHPTGRHPTASATPAAHRETRGSSATGRKDASTPEPREVHGLQPTSDGTREPHAASPDGAVGAPGGKTRDLAADRERAGGLSAPSRNPIGSAFGAGETRSVLPAPEEAPEPGAAGRDPIGGTPAAGEVSRRHASEVEPSRAALGHPDAADRRDHQTGPSGNNLPTPMGPHHSISSRGDTSPPQPQEARGVAPTLDYVRKQSAARRKQDDRESRRGPAPTAESRGSRVASLDKTADTREPERIERAERTGYPPARGGGR